MRAYITFWKFIHKLYKSGGFPYIVKYLKTSSVLLQQSVAGLRAPGQPLGAAVSTTRQGIPRIIPRELRARIRSRDRQVIRTWLTIFNLYRIIEIPGKLKLSTITDPGKELDLERVRGMGEIFFQYMLRTNKPFADLFMDLQKGSAEAFAIKPFLIPKSSGTTNYSTTVRSKIRDKVSGMWKWSSETIGWSFASTSPLSVSISAVLLRHDTVLFPLIREWCDRTSNSAFWEFLDKISTPFDISSHVKPVLSIPVLDTIYQRWHGGGFALGKLGFKEEAAGKVRVFAMVDCWTQWLFDPLHRGLFTILKAIPEDGTFDQHAPVRRLLDRVVRNKLSDLYSFDLSAATDRLPVAIQEILLSSLIGTRLAYIWRGLLTWRDYQATSEKYGLDAGTRVRYAVGQPMGALSSWAMLAFTHHFLVQWAAFNARKDKTLSFSWFTLYAVLGDDIVIGDKTVAAEYVKLMDELGVDISLAKSLISNRRVCEFAKTFWIPENATPIPFKEFLVIEKNSSAMLEFASQHELSLPDIFHALGYGYKTKASLYTKKLSKMGVRVRRLLIALTSPTGPFAKSLREWLTMESLSRSVDTNHWDRIAQSLVATEFPILIQKLKSLKKTIGIIVAGDPTQGEGDSPHRVAYDDTRVVMEILEKLRKNPRIAAKLRKAKVDLVKRTAEGFQLLAKMGLQWLSPNILPVEKALADPEQTPDILRPKNRKKAALFLLDKSYRISLLDLEQYGFNGDREEFLLQLYENLYSGQSKKQYLEVSKLLDTVESLFKELKAPQNWHEILTPLSTEKEDVYSIVETLWAKIQEIEDSIDDIPSFNNIVRRTAGRDYLDPSVSNSKLWTRVRRLAN